MPSARPVTLNLTFKHLNVTLGAGSAQEELDRHCNSNVVILGLDILVSLYPTSGHSLTRTNFHRTINKLRTKIGEKTY